MAAESIADDVWDAAVVDEFSGDPVSTHRLPGTSPAAGHLLADSVLAEFGLRIDASERQELVATCEVDKHVDNVDGLVLFLVLHTDGLKFRQGKVSHAPVAGEFFVFNDRRPHAVAGVKGKGVLLGWAIPDLPRET